MIPPKEKAKELCDKFGKVDIFIDQEPFKPIDCRIEDTDSKDTAKQCALIAVDEILKSIIWHHDFSNQTRNYWQEVKHEIEKL